MENQNLINEIKSTYILKNIFNYIKDNNFQLKLFAYSNYFQNKFDLKLVYKEKFIDKIEFDINKYLHREKEKYKIKYLYKKYKNFILEKKIDKKKLEEIIFYVLENRKIKEINNIKGESEKLIDIESPLFKIITKTKAFENNYTIYISQRNIDDNKLKDYYKRKFDELNNLNIKYFSIYYYFNEIKKINYLKILNIDFNKIKKISLVQEEDIEEPKKENYNDNKIFFETLFSFKNIENDLIYLKISFKKENILESNIFEKINNFKSLRYLYLKHFHFDKNLTIKLKNIEVLSCENCKNIGIFENFDIKSKKLNINYNNELEKVNFEKLEILNLEGNQISNIDILENANFKELKDLNLYRNNISDIKVLEKAKFEKLEILNLGSNEIKNIDILENVNCKELKELNLSYNDISDIKGLEKAKFEKLEILDLCSNKIKNIDILEKVNFKELIELNLCDNKIPNIKVLFQKVKFTNLQTLKLRYNIMNI